MDLDSIKSHLKATWVSLQTSEAVLNTFRRSIHSSPLVGGFTLSGDPVNSIPLS